MKPDAPLEIKVLYDASSRGRRKPVRLGRTTTRRVPGLWLGVVNLIVAATLYYGTWWQVDPFLYMTILMKTPIMVDVDMDQVGAQMFGIKPETPKPTASKNIETVPFQFSGKTAQILIPATSYAWLAWSTLAACLLATSAGGLISRAKNIYSKKIGVMAVVAAALILIAYVGYVWSNFGLQYRPDHLRFCIAGIVILGANTGILLIRRVAGLTRYASYSLILSAVFSAAGLTIGYYCDAIDDKYATIPFVAMVFGIHSIWGWILLVISIKSRSL